MIKKLNCQMMSDYSHAVSLELKMRTFGALLQVEFTFLVCFGIFFFVTYTNCFQNMKYFFA